MIDRRFALTLLCSTLAFSAARAASPAKPFDRKAFEASVAAGGPVIVHVSAPWCPICRAQHPILDRLRDQPRFSGFELYEISFDSDKASLRVVNAQLQSTIIVYGGGKEIARTVGDREDGWVEDLLEKALSPAPKPAGL